jgi:pyruvate,water dikinase
LGESIVGGSVTPDAYTVIKDSLKLKSTKIGDKKRMTVLGEVGTHEVGVPRLLRTKPALSELQAGEIARLARSLEQQMGWPVDVECAYQDEQLFLLQCRPVTALRTG